MDTHQLEEFSLAKDRHKALEHLIPGTEEFYFYSSLVHEQAGELGEVQALLDLWNKRYGETALFCEIRNRLALLRYGEAPKATLEYLRHHLGLAFDHQRAVEGRQTSHPTSLDPRLVSREAIRKVGLSHSNSSDLAGFTDAALEWLVDEPLDGQRLRQLLQRLTRPDFAKLPQLVAAELKDKHSSGFGALPIHQLLLQDQLEALRKLVPALAADERFVHAWITKLQPGPDVDWQQDAAEREAFLVRLWDYVEDLAPSFNPLKAHVLFHRLDHDRRQGVYDRERFLQYLKLPREVQYASPAYLKQFRKSEESPFGLGQDFRAVTLHAAVGSDEELVRDYLAHFFRDAKDLRPFETYALESFLKQVFATTKILEGVGDMEKWFSMLDDPGFHQALKERVELDFARTNRTWFGADDPVSLEVDVKNVPTLVVKVFEINSLNYFLAHGRGVDTSVDLDGLVASEEQTHQYSEPPLRRVRRTFAFPTLSRRGAFVVEVIGGGISSRALILKGKLRFLERAGAAGHVFVVLDEDRRPLQDAALWLAGREYKAEADGSINVPFSTNPGRQQILLRHGGLTTLEAFQHQGEDYQFVAGLYCDRESLLKKKEAKLVVRPTLRVSGVPARLGLIEEPTLLIQSTDRDGVASTLEVRDFKLQEERESVHTFQVPENLASLTFTLRGRIQNLSQGKKVELSDSRSLQLNGIDASASIEDLHLARTAEGFVANLLGKSGEPKAGVPINLTIVHRDLSPTLRFTLQTDDRGRVELGHLRDVVSLSVSSPSGVTEGWSVPRDRCRHDPVIHVRENEAFRVPFMEVEPLGAIHPLDELGKEAKPRAKIDRQDASLLERRGETFRRDRFDALSRSPGYLEIGGLPAGDYDLWLKRDGVGLAIRVAPGEDRAGWIAGERRHLERRDPRPLQICGVTLGKGDLKVTLGSANTRTRVHVFGTRFVPASSSFDELARAGGIASRAVELAKAPSHYVSGRDIGDEYRYILERKFSTRFAGNMLTRPGLLLNPWAVRSTATSTQEAQVGGSYAASPPCPACAPCESSADMGPQDGQGSHFANLDFLAQPSVVLLNLTADADGVVTVPRVAVEHANTLRVIAVDPQHTVCRDVLLPEAGAAPQDLRLRLALDADQHFSEKKQITVLAEGQPLEVADITTSKVEVYDTLARVHRLFSTLSGNAHLATFSFVVRWPGLTEAEKRAKYSEFACHELSFFLSRKDPEFFERVIRPYLRHKKEKTFLDRYLLGDDLSGHRQPWAFGRLNVVERILLANRVADEAGPVGRHCRELNELLPRDLERANHLFLSAIQSSALEAGDALGMKQGAANAEKALLASLDMASAAGEVAAFGRGGPGGGARLMAAPSAKGAVPHRREEAKKSRSRAMEKVCDEEEVSGDDADGFAMDSLSRDVGARERVRQLYQKQDTTQEWAENQYYQLLLEQQGPELVTINAFWRDWAEHRSGPFLSPNLAWATRNFTEMMLALAVLDLPFEADKPAVAFEGARMHFTGKGRSIAFHKEIKPVAPSAERVPVLVSQNYFRDDDRCRYENGEQVDKYVSGEFLVNVVYVCQAVLTNPTSTRQKLDLLLQIPLGSLPVRSGFYTHGKHLELSSYATESLEYAFYFPSPGTFAHFPVHVAKNEQLIACAPPSRLQVVKELSAVDQTSWAWVSQNGAEADVLRFLEDENVERLAQPNPGDGTVGLDLIAWRMRDRAFFGKCLGLLAGRHVYNSTLWSYGLHHGEVAAAREFLLHQDGFLDQCGPWLQSPLLRLDPVERRRYQHLEYAPLVNARTQKLGARRKILNDRFAQQYAALMTGLRYRAPLSDDDRLAVTYYLFLQDRVADALELLDTVDRRKVETHLQYDYLKVYAEFFRERPAAAREIAVRYQDHPVDRWRSLFKNALAQLDELAGVAAQVVDDKDRDQRQAKLASSEPDFDFAVEKKAVTVNFQNLAAVRVNYYRMDIELLFSRQPFVQQQSGQFSFIKPNRSDEVALPAGRSAFAFDLPAEFHGSNVIVEVVAEGKRKSQAYYAHELLVQVVENYGQVRVTQQGTGKPLSKTYVKVYARLQGGEVKFYKDGYTDLRGAFEYASLSTNELDHVERFSLLVLSEKHGSVIREAAPPKR